MELIERYFPDLTSEQRRQFALLGSLYATWNARINVISRKDQEQLYLRHVLHSLAIARVCRFDAGARVLDVGCGGGFPGASGAEFRLRGFPCGDADACFCRMGVGQARAGA